MKRKLIKVNFNGFIQNVEFEEETINYMGKEIKVLESKKRKIPLSEMIRIAEEKQIPIKNEENLVFPKNKKIV